LTVIICALQQNRYGEPAGKIIAVRVILFWWRRRESNPRPKIFI